MNCKCENINDCPFGCHGDHENDSDMDVVRQALERAVRENAAALERLAK